MKKTFIAILIAASPAIAVEIPVQQVADDAKVIDRVAQAAKKDLPDKLLQRIVNEDIEWLRGRHTDGTYDYATYERFESGRSTETYSAQSKKDDSTTRMEIKGPFVYRLIIEIPTRRMLVRQNKRVFIDHVDIEYIPMNNSASQSTTVKVGEWFEPGQSRPVEFPEVARQATVKVYAKGDPGGYGNVDLTLVNAKIIDKADSPYADAVASAKAIDRAIDNYDIPSIRAMAQRMRDDLTPKVAPVVESVPVKPPVQPPPAQPQPVVATAPPPAAPPVAAAAPPSADLYTDLLTVEDLLTGTEAEKREGLEKLHQLVRKLRPH